MVSVHDRVDISELLKYIYETLNLATVLMALVSFILKEVSEETYKLKLTSISIDT